ncbi:Ig kappa chain V region 3368 [Rhinichthys klamathensis goyatoka]|uniref:Ig kappa chain V region 3368 n=1 Tax=Rhinichthys klamathensis goyatoka TaxID=3034132 RepID=UPI0024B52460|nr:Ig kappa chain V region 3368 [Rhinichthys klamathensis goyatoka]
MTLIIIFISILAAFYQECRGQVTITQTPAITAAHGTDVRINCKANRPVHNNDFMAWYFKRSGEAPKLLVYRATHRFTGASSRFTGSGHGADFTLTITGVQSEDAGHYFCQSDHTGAIITQ